MHRRDDDNKGRRRTYQRSDALNVVNLDTLLALVLRGRTRNLLIPRQQQLEGTVVVRMMWL